MLCFIFYYYILLLYFYLLCQLCNSQTSILLMLCFVKKIKGYQILKMTVKYRYNEHASNENFPVTNKILCSFTLFLSFISILAVKKFVYNKQILKSLQVR